MKLQIKDLTFEWTTDNELVIEIAKGIPQSRFVDGDDLKQLIEFINGQLSGISG